MKIILRQVVENLGAMGEIVTVRDGYARNYLIPKNLAYYATPGALKAFESEKKRYIANMAKLKAEAELLASKLTEVQLSIGMKVGEEGRLFGTVTQQMVADELQLRGYDVDKRNVTIDEPIKSLGVFDVKVKLHPEVTTTVKVWVISE